VIDDKTPLEKFAIPIELLEKTSGLEFFQRLPRANGRFVMPLCKSTKCELPAPFQPKSIQAAK
jgi:DNA/RNA endonuclease G (NUC1)